MTADITEVGQEPPEHLKPVLEAIYKALALAPEGSLLLAVVRTPHDLAFVSNGDAKDIDEVIVELMMMIKGGGGNSAPVS